MDLAKNSFRYQLVLTMLGWLILAGCAHLLQVQYVYAPYPHGVEFVGIKRTENAPVTFFSIRIRSSDDGRIDPECPVVLNWAGKKLRVAELTTESVISAGIPLKPRDYKSPGHLFGFIAGADEHNSDYGIEFQFKDGRLIEFYARHNWSSSVSCPFTVGFGDAKPTCFPLSQDRLIESFGEPKTLVVQWGK